MLNAARMLVVEERLGRAFSRKECPRLSWEGEEPGKEGGLQKRETTGRKDWKIRQGLPMPH